MSSMVSASGALATVTSQNLGFSKAAKLIELDVKVGDSVNPGQILAKEDPFSFNQALNQQKALLVQRQAALTKLIRDVTVPGTRATLDQAKRILDAVRNNVDAQLDAARNTVERAHATLRFAEVQLDRVKDAARAACAAPVAPAAPQPVADPGAGAQQPGLGGLGSALGSATATAGGQETPACTSAKNAARTTYGTTYLPAKTAYKNAQFAQDSARASGRISIRQAQQTVISNQNALDVARTNRPSDIAAAQAAVANQVSVVAVAQHDLDNAILYAPVGGTISAITGAVGEYLPGSSSGTTALAPGTDAAIPGVGAAATSDQSGNASSGISATRPGGGAFIVLNNINTYQVVVPFEES
ncbi:MAG TPA: hypothetical protein VGH89_16695, partial [Pseudonocardia sp.]